MVVWTGYIDGLPKQLGQQFEIKHHLFILMQSGDIPGAVNSPLQPIKNLRCIGDFLQFSQLNPLNKSLVWLPKGTYPHQTKLNCWMDSQFLILYLPSKTNMKQNTTAYVWNLYIQKKMVVTENGVDVYPPRGNGEIRWWCKIIFCGIWFESKPYSNITPI